MAPALVPAFKKLFNVSLLIPEGTPSPIFFGIHLHLLVFVIRALSERAAFAGFNHPC